jgi:hypothetical protein
MSRRKPRGVNEVLKVTGGLPLELIPSPLPTEKSGIEARILDLTLKAAEFMKIDLYNLVSPPVQNDENNFDFTLDTASGTEYLDLVEIVLEGGYDGASTSIAVGDMADQMFEQIKKKARKYGTRRRSNIHLLLYSTHWKFLPNESLISLLSLYCVRKHHGFKTVAVMMPIMDEAAVLWKCFPAALEITSNLAEHERSLRARVLTQLDPRKAQSMPDGSVGWELPG